MSASTQQLLWSLARPLLALVHVTISIHELNVEYWTKSCCTGSAEVCPGQSSEESRLSDFKRECISRSFNLLLFSLLAETNCSPSKSNYFLLNSSHATIMERRVHTQVTNAICQMENARGLINYRSYSKRQGERLCVLFFFKNPS